MSKNNHTVFPILNLLRFIAALIVVFHHFAIYFPPFDEGLLNRFFGNGNFMVNFFFVLSGFVLVHRFKHQDLSDKEGRFGFYRGRAVKLLPLFFVGAFAYLFIYIYYNEQTDFLRIFISFFGFQAWDVWSFPVLNVPSWSLSVEFFLYILFPWLLPFFVKKRNLNFNLMIILLWILIEILFHFVSHEYSNLHMGFLPPFALPSFLLGMMMYGYLDNVRKWKKTIKEVCLILFVSLAIFALLQPYFYKNYSGQLGPLFAVIILFAAACSEKPKEQVFKVSNSLGHISYPIYILHFPLHAYVMGIFSLGNGINLDSMTIFFLIYLVIMILVSFFANKLNLKIRNRIEKIITKK